MHNLYLYGRSQGMFTTSGVTTRENERPQSNLTLAMIEEIPASLAAPFAHQARSQEMQIAASFPVESNGRKEGGGGGYAQVFLF